ncbi:mechanosensitive ion channel family protein [Glaciibacter psychrotolerans]|uniref:Small conductance mechanosensitive channel n=1 Tax=Glaciibacter psychrotolerans TaxID=670054 RepID=A0A7Z0EDL5_9MICO|nr:mechanosensitive ion channel domain-containing protein [Leifsonia psychrotolerans]NYJ19240.1 small conductance mechanosensitive channel [Leifsonia psychrotolerans]
MNLDSFWAAIGAFFSAEIIGKLITILIIIAVALLLRWVLHFAIDRIVRRIVSGAKKKQNVTDTQALNVSPLAAVRVVQRTRTLGSVLSNVVNVLILVISVLWIIQTLNSTILGSFALLTAAVGAGLGFGAQNIVKDALNGLFMVMEDQLGVGDVVDVGPATGMVEAVGIRITQVRDVNGILWFVRNGEILRVGNMSQGWARAIIDLAVPYDTDVDAVQEEILRVALEMSSSSKWRSRMLEKPEVWGLESISADALVIRLVVKTRTSTKDDVSRELRIRLKKALDEMGLTLPSLNSVVLTGFDGADSVTGARPPRTRPVNVVAEAKPARKTKRQPAVASAAPLAPGVALTAPAQRKPATAPRPSTGMNSSTEKNNGN